MSARRPLLSWVTPTRNRPERHEACYRDFCADAWEEKELVVLDESDAPSAFFTALEDERVRYVHEPGRPRIDGVTRIGETRNRMVALARGEILLHRDDDDHYAPGYSAAMVERLERAGAACAKLVVFRLLHEPTRTLFEWDLRRAGGKHYAVQGPQVAEVTVDARELGEDFGPEMMEAFRCGFGWSLVYRKEVAERYPFPVEGVEDIAFVKGLLQGGERVVFVADCAHLGVHTVHVDSQHPTGGSAHFPQKRLGAGQGQGQSETRLRQGVRQRMIGAMGSMTEIPERKTLRLSPGRTYAILASVRKKHSLRSLSVRAEAWGIRLESVRDDVSPGEFGVAGTGPAAGDDYRLVHAVGRTERPVTIPWRTPSFLRAIGEASQIVAAWAEPAAEAAQGEGDTAVGAGAALVQPEMGLVEETQSVQLHPGAGDIAVLPGRVYVGTALVKDAHGSGAIAEILESLGIVLEQYKESPSDRGGYRFVRFRGVATDTAHGMLPWRLPWPLRVIDDSHILSCSFTAAPGQSRVIGAGAGAAESFHGIPDGMGIARLVDRVDDLPGGLTARWTGAGRPIWENAAGAVVLQSPETGRFAVLEANGTRPRTGAGATDYVAQAASLPGAEAAWAQVQASLSGEGQGPDQIGYAALSFVSAYQQVPLVNPSGQVGDAVNAAMQFTLSNHSTAAAAGQIVGLVGAIVGGGSPAQVFQDFTGTLTATASLAVAAGAVSFGVGAAIVVGLEIVTSIVGLNNPPAPVAMVGACKVYGSSPPKIVNGWTWSWGEPTSTGPGNTALWRTFPDPANSRDTGWFQPNPTALGDAVNWNWTFGGMGHTDVVYTCFAQGEQGKRPIDQIANEPQGPPASPTGGPSVYHHLEVEASLAKATLGGSPNDTLANFSLAYFAAWKANREYGLNGLAQRTDAEVLGHLVQKWNLANTGPAVTIAPSGDAPLGWNAGAPGSITPYASILLGSSGGQVAGTDAQGALHINGHTLGPVAAAGGGAATSASGKTLKTAAVATVVMAGVASAASVGVALSQGLPWHHFFGQAWGGARTIGSRLGASAGASARATGLLGAGEERRLRNPLHRGRSEAVFRKNVAMLRREGMPRDRALAAAYRERRRAGWRG